jgi:hypothetical protein
VGDDRDFFYFFSLLPLAHLSVGLSDLTFPLLSILSLSDRLSETGGWRWAGRPARKERRAGAGWREERSRCSGAAGRARAQRCKLDGDNGHVRATAGVVGRRGRGAHGGWCRQPLPGEGSPTAAARAGGGVGELGARGAGAGSTAAGGRQGKLDSDSSHVGATIGGGGRRGRRRTSLGGSASFMRRQPRRGGEVADRGSACGGRHRRDRHERGRRLLDGGSRAAGRARARRHLLDGVSGATIAACRARPRPTGARSFPFPFPSSFFLYSPIRPSSSLSSRISPPPDSRRQRAGPGGGRRRRTRRPEQQTP